MQKRKADEHEIRADRWEREPECFAKQFRKWFEWLQSKERGSDWYGYRLNVSRFDAKKKLWRLQVFTDSIREFMAGRTEPPIVSVELFTGYLSDLRRASEFNEARPEMYSMECLEELQRRLPESKLPEIETANSIVRKWASRATGKENEQLPKKQSKTKKEAAKREEEICREVYDSFPGHPTRDAFQKKCCDVLKKYRGRGIGATKASEMWNRFLNEPKSSSAPSSSSASSGGAGQK